ncbi:1,2-phenylacetyl-CoA epoxidase subunit PaaD [Rugosimonospora africana]|uniref:1,2-phenylacetyl-CoA epoxidase subunit PaaD n=1 Tax=Rugosimonospora africana TaxID=556532 RepID=UPI001EF2BB65|nr:1,2-phenylacetyl-CoA epoxidase subunit PaaD [Rugosimonospora africana]
MARNIVAAVADPELVVLTIDELGVLRSVAVDAGGRVTVTITPTYSGCPAMDAIRADIRAALAAAGHRHVDIVTRLDPPWSTDLISESGRTKLAAAGIAPPVRLAGPVPVALSVKCPRCGSLDTERLSQFGSTACKALWRCRGCREPFDQIKPL